MRAVLTELHGKRPRTNSPREAFDGDTIESRSGNRVRIATPAVRTRKVLS
jgi:hypothetical protein